MVKTINRIGNSQGLIFDAALMELLRLKVGDQINVTVHDGGDSVVLTPVRKTISPEKGAATAERIIRKNSELFRRLA